MGKIFSFYAAKVKHLSVIIPNSPSKRFPMNLSSYVAIGRTMLVLFPNIKSLRIEELPPRFMGFCRLMYHRTLTNAVSSFRGSRHASMEVEPAIRELSLRAPFIRDLSVELEDYVSDDPVSFISNELSRLQCLERIELPPVMVINHVFELLAILPDLQRIDFLFPGLERRLCRDGKKRLPRDERRISDITHSAYYLRLLRIRLIIPIECLFKTRLPSS
ncbi:hypothetical protein A7U60_g3192 [Sanghuangporus baumii]|uniref:Uncharacterized protein n=1 Tax=Sanghuangporus baumii TaxID=108892 RepID=A0A9Q5I143_SANBA|nr:hypothetical protein A7U60_g3192 [Sanghuangporus baumii]